jgi:bis(5'-nucleosyl)-tetraphosphatase (symmetrical)
MSTYVIGDVQGCYDQLLRLLDAVHFDDKKDFLWFTGDLVNRGPKSLEVLRFVSSLPCALSVLGNHDLSLLALAYTDITLKKHTLDKVLSAPDREPLLAWLLKQPLLFEDKSQNTILVHAGIPPGWNTSEAKTYAHEVENCLQSDSFKDLLRNMFGNTPNAWDPNLSGWDRFRFIINALTRMRFCTQRGELDLTYKGNIENAPPDLIPWYKLRKTSASTPTILFGHWASLQGKADASHVIPLDTGCFWGGSLTALRLEDNQRFITDCQDI